jgi:hypothetical protein
MECKGAILPVTFTNTKKIQNKKVTKFRIFKSIKTDQYIQNKVSGRAMRVKAGKVHSNLLKKNTGKGCGISKRFTFQSQPCHQEI